MCGLALTECFKFRLTCHTIHNTIDINPGDLDRQAIVVYTPGHFMGVSVDDTIRHTDYIQRQFVKLFKPDGPRRKRAKLVPFVGTIISYNKHTALYHVHYEDNDEEDLDLSEVQNLNFLNTHHTNKAPQHNTYTQTYTRTDTQLHTTTADHPHFTYPQHIHKTPLTKPSLSRTLLARHRQQIIDSDNDDDEGNTETQQLNTQKRRIQPTPSPTRSPSPQPELKHTESPLWTQWTPSHSPSRKRHCSTNIRKRSRPPSPSYQSCEMAQIPETRHRIGIQESVRNI